MTADRPPLRRGELRELLLTPGGPLAKVEVVDAVGSTSSAVADELRVDPESWPDRSLLVADQQVAGRGRAGRSWVTPARAALTATLVLRPGVPPERWGWLPLLAGLGAVTALRATAGVPAVLKWPNDVLVDLDGHVPELGGWGTARKVGGILTEVVALPGGSTAGGATDGAGAAVLIGIGVNVSQTVPELPVESATSLALAGAQHTDRETVLTAVVSAVLEVVDRWAAADGDAALAGVAAEVAAVCETLGRRVHVELPGGGVLDGAALRLDATGALVVGGPDGEHVVAAGDVLHVRGQVGRVAASPAATVADGPGDRTAGATGVAAEPAPADSTVAKLDEVLLGGPRTLTAGDLALRAGVDEESVRTFWRTFGLAAAEPDERAYTERDAEAVRALVDLVRREGLQLSTVRTLVRGLGHTTDRLALWQVEALVEDAATRYRLDDASARLLVLDRLAAIAPVLEQELVLAFRRQLATIGGRFGAELGQARQVGTGPSDLPLARAVGFADMVQFTRRTAGLGSTDLSAFVQRFEAAARDVVAAAGGRVVKTIGDAVLFVADDVVTGAEVALGLAARFGDGAGAVPDDLTQGARGVTPVRVGMVWGRVLSRFGDVFGASVNLAARLTDITDPSSVWVDATTAALLADDPRYVLTALPPRDVEGLGTVEPVALGRA
ncbi:biotin--[acetyl-CoA-carboxylase] ligase [Cellulomonas sp. SG140]|uniref:biotin--[acetyl-CoA-carboxylase] ligase n=1 Tax=Cellulomonas sp. SG140 TaxID=2976536 RepID=UPI00298801A3|nr:biotin--[acetyl-CoA-carboxylase] ligase [Cellulomonas sp. SG140]